jgi:hypothetical protein
MPALPYLNNIVQQDHRFKKAHRGELWFRSVEGTVQTVAGTRRCMRYERDIHDSKVRGQTERHHFEKPPMRTNRAADPLLLSRRRFRGVRRTRHPFAASGRHWRSLAFTED